MANSIVIPKGSTLTGLAKQYKTTVADLMKANPQIKNANLIYAGQNLNLPSVAAPAPAPVAPVAPVAPAPVSPIAPAPVATSQPNASNPWFGIPAEKSASMSREDAEAYWKTQSASSVTSNEQANAFINADQQKDAAAAAATGEPEIKKSFQEASDLMASLKETVAPTTEKPALPNLKEAYLGYRTEYGLDTLETTLNDLNAQAAAINAEKQSRITAEKGKSVAMNVISGRVSEVEQQENERLTAINTQIKTVSDQLDTKYKIIDTLMTLTDADYTNASADYDKQMSTNISLFNAIRGIQEDEKTEEERVTDNARSSLQIVYNQLANGTMEASALTETQKATITKLEIQSGLPLGTFATLRNADPKANIIATNNWTDASNNEYVSIITKGADGQLKTNNILLGKAKAAAAGAGEKASESEILLYYKQNMSAELQKVAGKDGFISQESWAKARKKWTDSTPYSAKDFVENFIDYVNPEYEEDYVGVLEYKK